MEGGAARGTAEGLNYVQLDAAFDLLETVLWRYDEHFRLFLT